MVVPLPATVDWYCVFGSREVGRWRLGLLWGGVVVGQWLAQLVPWVVCGWGDSVRVGLREVGFSLREVWAMARHYLQCISE